MREIRGFKVRKSCRFKRRDLRLPYSQSSSLTTTSSAMPPKVSWASHEHIGFGLWMWMWNSLLLPLLRPLFLLPPRHPSSLMLLRLPARVRHLVVRNPTKRNARRRARRRTAPTFTRVGRLGSSCTYVQPSYFCSAQAGAPWHWYFQQGHGHPQLLCQWYFRAHRHRGFQYVWYPLITTIPHSYPRTCLIL